MVARPHTDASVHTRIDRLGTRHDELARAVTRGPAALRDQNGNLLTMNGGISPQLTDQSGGAALAFQQDGSLAAVTSDGAAHVPFSAASLSSDGNVTAAFDAYSRNVYLSGGAIFSENTDGAVRFHADADGGGFDSCNRSGSEYRGMRSNNFLTVTPSWRAVKTHHRTTGEYLGKGAAEIVDSLQVGAWRYDPDRVTPNYADGRDHYGLMLDELPLELTRTVQSPTGSWVTTYERDEVLNLALAAVQDRGREINALREEVRELRASLEAHVNPAA